MTYHTQNLLFAVLRFNGARVNGYEHTAVICVILPEQLSGKWVFGRGERCPKTTNTVRICRLYLICLRFGWYRKELLCLNKQLSVGCLYMHSLLAHWSLFGSKDEHHKRTGARRQFSVLFVTKRGVYAYFLPRVF